MNFFDLYLKYNKNYNDILKILNNSDKPEKICLTGVFSSHKNYIISSFNLPSLIVCENEEKALQTFNDLKFFLKDRVNYYPNKDFIFYNADIKSYDTIKNRFKVINNILNKKNQVIILSIESLFDKLVDKEVFEKFILNFKVGDNLEIEKFSQKLIFMGYERVDNLESQGQFTVRGGIIDIFSPVFKNAFRIELWGDEIDSIRILDSFFERSVEKVEKITIYPIRELVYTERELELAIEKLELDLKFVTEKYLKNNELDKYENIKEKINEVLEKLKTEKSFSGIEKYIEYFYSKTVSILDYIDKDTIIFFNEISRCKEEFLKKQEEFFNIINSSIDKGNALPSNKNVLFSYNDILRFIEKFNCIFLNNFDLNSNFKDFNIEKVFNFKAKNISILKNNLENFFDNLNNYKKSGYKIIFLSSNTSKCEIIEKELNEKGLTSIFLKNYNNFYENYDFKNGIVYIIRGNLSTGFECLEEKFILITDSELFVQKSRNRKKQKVKGIKIESFSELKVGDYVVHDNHGIGIFKGIEQINSEGVKKDYFKIGYADDGVLYIPINQLDIVQKYIYSSENTLPKINKLGGKQWSNIKNKAKDKIKILAKDLINLYAKRQSVKGFAYSKDNIWQKEFEDSFIYEETQDQLNAIEDVKSDMESTRVMDRLICGDVGFGKTEVAIRAVFKAVQDKKQVVVLAPTTILVKQHYDNFCKRMQDYPIKIEMLSRFRTVKQQKQTIDEIKKGNVNIIIGTHRVLSKDIEYKDLGLIVIDEEQRFGVAHKEKLKSLKDNVDVLSLSATPIPRTLHMSMAGIRDMSLLEEPPSQRIPIQTYVLEKDYELIKTAIFREIERGGQVYYLYNRVLNIEQETKILQDLIPEASITFAHGQMNERELEKIMISFMKNEINVLVCTTIIETGLDIPNVNTIIIQNADKMGLSQLYQLRGRVGRANKTAFAYLMYNKDRVLKEVSEKRLQTIKEFTEFGSGFKIAMRDLEIRGAGNLLGAEQHGHMELIGYEMYCKLLEQAIAELKGEKVKKDFETLIEIPVNAFIPDSYIKNQSQKFEMYKKISYIKTLEDFYSIQDELEDRFGDIPKFVQNLLNVALMKSYAHNIGVTSVIQRGNKITINFKKDKSFNTNILMDIISKNPQKFSYSGVLVYKVSEYVDSVLDLKNLFEKIKL